MHQKQFPVLAALAILCGVGSASAATAYRLNPNALEVKLQEGSSPLLIDFYGPNIFRIFQDPQGEILRDPQANPPAQILVDNPRRNPGDITVKNLPDGSVVIATPRVQLDFAANGDTFTVTDLITGRLVAESVAPIEYAGNQSTVRLKERPDEWFYGGGVQNGRFSHKGKSIDIVNTNSWTDGGVASPTPFYWSTGGYGIMWHTFAPGAYDFGASTPGEVALTHNAPYLDLFVMVNDSPVSILNDFYQLTGNPVLLPKFGLYEGHLNAYNRDYWKEDPNGILYEDGKRYKESQTDNGGIRESLNGELQGNYQFSARAVIDRYNAHDMPLGWVLPNDGYGAGYGQTETLDGNIENLRQYGEYAHEQGVEIGLWTQSDLYPKEGVEPVLQRDIVKEVRDAGVRALKTDVAWVGAGYSFGLNGVADVGEIMPYYGNDARPFIISVCGWAGTQRYAGIWTGDQTGGQWEYIRFHIPTYIGSGLSGQPNIGSDVDGIFGGNNIPVNVRDYQWKTFTPMQLNMDGWGANPKYPHQLGENVANINRAYLKLKSELVPYAYTYAREAVDGKPLIRAMFLDYPNDFTHSAATRYQFLYGPDLLVAPIYQETRADSLGNDVRHNIYLPAGRWFDYFSGQAYTSDGAMVLNNFEAPLWKLPVFVKAGAIIPMVNPNNNPSQINRHQRIYEFWPEGRSEMTEYDDDGTTQAWLRGESATTKVTSDLSSKGVLTITIAPTQGSFTGMTVNKSTILRINATAVPKQVMATVRGKMLKLTAATSQQQFESADAAWMFVEQPNRLSQWGVEDSTPMIPQIWVKLPSENITTTPLSVEVKGFELNPEAQQPAMLALTAPEAPAVILNEEDIKPYDVTLRWTPIADAASVELLHNGILYTNLGTSADNSYFMIEDLQPETAYAFKLRAMNPAGASEWTEINLTTAANPLEFAIKGITATCTAPSQPGSNLSKLFDLDEREIWHTQYGETAVPFSMTINLNSFNTLDRLEYLPRVDAGNGTILHGTWEISENGTDWTDPVEFTWNRDAQAKTIIFDGAPMVRFIRLNVDKALGNFGSGRQIYVFRTPGSPSFIPGDINKDGKLDSNDLTSYMNYMGLKQSDADFDYVSMGDVNRNGQIDVQDVCYVATVLNGGIDCRPEDVEMVSGALDVAVKRIGNEVALSVTGNDLKSLNGFGFAIPYNPAELEYIGTETTEVTAKMENLTNDRMHSDGAKVLYPTLVNLGSEPDINGSPLLLTIKFRAKKSNVTPHAENILLVDKLIRNK